jgi:hypothetical protein
LVGFGFAGRQFGFHPLAIVPNVRRQRQKTHHIHLEPMLETQDSKGILEGIELAADQFVAWCGWFLA